MFEGAVPQANTFSNSPYGSGPMEKRTVSAMVPVTLEFPDEIAEAILEVLEGEYESGYSGENLTILDIGANVGSFAIWANMRWPNSQIHSFEPDPETFATLVRNVGHLPNITCHNLAVYPSNNQKELFNNRLNVYGTSGLIKYIYRLFDELPTDSLIDVSILHPRNLPDADIIKIDTEGAEAEVLNNINLSNISLILLEYHVAEDRENIKKLLQNDFMLEREDNYEWAQQLRWSSDYKNELFGDQYGRLFFVAKRNSKLTKDFFYRQRKDKLLLRRLFPYWVRNLAKMLGLKWSHLDRFGSIKDRMNSKGQNES